MNVRRRFFLLLTVIFLLFAASLKAQTITGQVYRTGTDSIISQASVYYGGSLTGALTNNKGKFTLPAKQSNIPLTISCVGYYSAVVNNYNPNQIVKVYLNPKVEQLKEVNIHFDGMPREEKEKQFIKEFLGTSEYALSCTITNLNDIDLNYNPKTKILTGNCNNPIEIDNKKLGYHISYFLDKFEKTPKNTVFIGDFIFKESASVIDLDVVLKNRQNVYEGSRMQFIRALWANKLKENNFKIISFLLYKPLVTDSIISGNEISGKFINLPYRVIIKYKDNAKNLSYVTQTKRGSYIDENGFYDSSLRWSGPMSLQRIGDLLPFEYKSEKDTVRKPITIDSNKIKVEKAHLFTAVDSGNYHSGFKLFFEKVYLHTDRENCVQGENIWFKAYLVNAETNALISSSKNLYVELISPEAKIIDREVIRLNNGTGNGDFKLADTISPGNYRIRAYTNWMRNFGDNFVFEKPFTVFSTSTIESSKQADNNNKNPSSSSSSQTNTKKIPIKEALPSIQFFPESGSLVENVAGLVAFKAEDAAGNGIAVKGSVYTEKGDTVIHFESTALGMGSFFLVPDADKKYLVKGVFNNKLPFASALPSALKKGFVMHVGDADSSGFRVTVSTNQATLQDFPNHQITLTGRHGGQRFLNGPVTFNLLRLNIRIPKAQFPAGISTLTVYDDQAKPQCERLVYVEEKNSVNASFITNKSVYRPKEKVTLKLKATDANHQPVKASFSVAAVDENFIDKNSINIASYLLLQSELHGQIKNPETYFDTTNINRFKQLDLLLLTQGWRDYLWRRLADTAIKISYLPEQGFDISGRLRQKFADQPLPGKNIALTVNGSAMSMRYNALTDAAGKFHLDNIELYGKQSISISATNDKDKNAGLIELDSAKKNSLPIKAISFFKADSSIQNKQTVVAQSLSKRQSLSDTLRLKEVKIKDSKTVVLRDITAQPFGYPDQAFNITSKDYSYQTLDNWLAHHVKGAITSTSLDTNGVIFYGVKKVGLGSGFRMKQIKMAPKFIVNGKEIYIDDRDPPEMADAIRSNYFKLPMDKVEKVTARHLVGVDLESADQKDVFIIYLTIKPDALLTQKANTINTELDGYYQSRVFYAPKYDQPKPKTGSDLRITIHWEPNLVTNANGEATITFYNADVKTKIRIMAEGLTEKGVPVVGKTAYQVQ